MTVAPPAMLRLGSKLIGARLDPPGYDATEAEQLLQAHLPMLETIAPDRVQYPRVDLDATGRALLTVYALSQVPEVHVVFEAASQGGLFVMSNLERMRELTLVAIHAFRKAESAGALKSSARVSPELDAESAEIEKRMQTVCEHFFPNDPFILSLRPGIGYVDRAYDMLGYADHYEKNTPAVTGHVQYRATDVTDARRLAAEILKTVDQERNPEQRVAFDQLRRAWTVLEPVYFEVRSAGLYGLRYVPEREELFPSVYVVGRKGVGRKKAAAKDAGVVADTAGDAAGKKESAPAAGGVTNK
ncbi:MAG: hypothetical protein U0441_29940 [Polyangiaceae bacterium]